MSKKIAVLFSAFILLLTLAACNRSGDVDDEVNLDELISLVDIGYSEGDNEQHVTNNLRLVSKDLGDVSISWSSSNETSIKIEGTTGIVTRSDNDETVTLTATLKYQDLRKSKTFSVVVIGLEEETVNLDDLISEVDLEFSGSDDIDHVTADVTLISPDLGDVTLQWSSNVESSIMIEGETAVVNQIESDVTVILTATLTYEEEVRTKTFELTVLAAGEDNEVPLILGLSNYVFYVDDETPNWLENVSAIDNVDSDVSVTYDASNVDLSTAGTYQLRYSATDSFNNKTEIEVTVVVIERGQGETYVETFDNLGLSGSSYTSGEFTGVNGVKWSFNGARGDLDLDGQAIGFGGSSSDDSYLEATIDGGITSLSFDFDKPFSNGQQYNVYINDELIGSFNNSNGSGTFEASDLSVSSAFTLLIKPDAPDNRKQATIDNLTWSSYGGGSISEDLQSLINDFNDLDLPHVLYTDTTLDLASSGSEGSSISWSLVNNNNHIDMDSHIVTIPENGQSQIVLKATLSLNSETITKTFVITIGKGDLLTLNQSVSLPNDSFIYTKGTVVAKYPYSLGTVIYLSDSTTTFKLYVDGNAEDISLYDVIEIEGYKNSQRSANVESIEILSTATPTFDEVSYDDLLDYENEFVSVSGYLAEDYSSSASSYMLKTLEGDITVDIYSDLYDQSAIKDLFASFNSGTKLDVFGLVKIENGSFVIYLSDVSDIEVSNDSDTSDLNQIILNELETFEIPSSTSSDINLPSSSDLIFNATITWSSNQPQVLSNSGVVGSIDEDAQVVLSYQIYNSDQALIDSGSYEITVLASTSNYQGTYYDGINLSLSGSSFRYELQDLISDMNDRGYDYAKTVLQVSDEDPNNPNNIILVYDRSSIISTWNGTDWNREHVWPQSKLGTASKSDLFNLRPSDNSINSRRSNYPFGDNRTNSSQGYGLYSGYWYPGDDDRGDIARAILYMNTRWGLSIGSSVIGSLDTFLAWHEADPVDEFEMHRNDVIYSYQNNRNPYVDHPEWVSKVYGNTSSNKADTSNIFNTSTLSDMYLEEKYI